MERYFKTILVAVDFSDKSLLAIEQAIGFSKILNTSITLIHIVEENNMLIKLMFEGRTEKMIEMLSTKLEELAEDYRKISNHTIHTVVEKGKIYNKIADFASEALASFVIIGKNSSELSDDKQYIGANTSRIVRLTRCPVITCSGASILKDDCRVIVLPLDLTKETTQKINKAIEIGKLFGATIKVVSALNTDDPEISAQLKKQMSEVKSYIEDRNVYCTTTTVKDDFGTSASLSSLLLDYCDSVHADLILIMTQQESNWVKYFVGSSAQEILRNAQIPVLSIIPAKSLH